MLAAGATLGPYKILAPLGAGGMGEVYRARDTRLGRDVAIKVIPAELARDPERIERFEQEALAAGALNHPGLCSILDLHAMGSRNEAPTRLEHLGLRLVTRSEEEVAWVTAGSIWRGLGRH